MGIHFSRIISNWDVCIDDWLKNSKSLTGLLSTFKAMVGTGLLSDDYIPEPYYGDPDNCSAVVININPGGSAPNEIEKEWSYRNNTTYRLIYDLLHKYSGKYSLFQAAYSPFTAPSWVPGVDWWAKYRIDFINRIVTDYNLAKGRGKLMECPPPLAMELCPLHSKNTSGLNFGKKAYFNHYKNNVILPAEEAVGTSQIPFGLAFASSIERIMNKCGYTQVLLHWKDGVDLITGTTIPNWPQKSNGVLKKRTYKLISYVKGNMEENAEGNVEGKVERHPFLLTWDNSGSIIKIDHKMMLDYQLVDKALVNAIASII